MKKWIILIFLLHIKGITASPLLINKTITIVNNQIVLENDINKNIIFSKMQFLKNHICLPKDNIIYKNVKKRLIIDKIILNTINKLNWNIYDYPFYLELQHILIDYYLTELQFNHYLKLMNINCNYTYQDYLNHIKNILMISVFTRNVIKNSIYIKKSEINHLAQYILSKNKIINRIKIGVLFLFDGNFIKNKYIKIFLNRVVNNSHKGFILKKIIFMYKNHKKYLFFKKQYWDTIKNIQLNYSLNCKSFKKTMIFNSFNVRSGSNLIKILDFKKKSKQYFLNEILLQHIMIKKSKLLSIDQSYKKIKTIYMNIKNHLYSFEHAAKNFSDDFISSYQGGNLGWLNQKKVTSKIYLEILKLNKFDLSVPFFFDDSWHLFRLLNSRSLDITNKMVQLYSYNIFIRNKIDKLTKDWRNKLYKNTYIKTIS